LFLRNPHLFSIGIKGECFAFKHMALWIFYGIVHALVIYFINFYAVANLVSKNGYTMDLWVPGHVVYGSCVIVVNLIVLVRINSFDKYGVGLIVLMIVGFYI
jgi:hypothetical protein